MRLSITKDELWMVCNAVRRYDAHMMGFMSSWTPEQLDEWKATQSLGEKLVNLQKREGLNDDDTGNL